MKANKKPSRSKAQLGVFLFFLGGLFFLQIVFAFTIHGDIGPHTNVIPGIEKPASPVLVGRIDSLISEARLTTPVRVAPEAALAPASRDFANSVLMSAKITTDEAIAGNRETTVKTSENERFVEYNIQSGDTLERISRKLYGNSQMVQSIVRINRIKDEKNLQLGSNIKVPRNGLLATVKLD